MGNEESRFELPGSIERYLSALSKIYAQDGKQLLQQIVVNSQTRIIEGRDYDSWNGGVYGHVLYLAIPERLFLTVLKQKEEMQEKIKKDLNGIHNVQGEYISAVLLEMENTGVGEWRKESGLLIAAKKSAPSDAIKRIWGENGFRIFLSHKAEVKNEVVDLKSHLRVFGVSCFVAHEDIHPTMTWQDEIEYALLSMDGFVALMTADYHDSDWTDQEVGYAFARGVPIIAMRLGKDPYGFIGKFQALSCDWKTAHEEIIKVTVVPYAIS
jgi:hypothetical protein